MTKEQIESLKRMVNSNNVNDIVLACQIIYQNKPFDNWRTLVKTVKWYFSTKVQVNTQLGQGYIVYGKPYSCPDNTFLKKILEIPMSKTLYKKDSSGNIRYLKIWTEKDELVQESGVVGTENPIEHRKTCKGKNIGKSNETTPEKQAKLEMQSKIIEKLKEDYFEKLEDAKNGQVILPMLAKTYKDHKHKIDWDNAYIQPKLDGMRCLAIINGENVKLISRQGTEITTVPHIVEALKGYTNGSCVLDGELYLHGVGFQNNMKLVKKNRPGETDKIQYWVYDVVSDESFWDRRKTLGLDVLNHPSIVEVETTILPTEESISTFHKFYLKEGYEGSMIRWGLDGYKINGRSENLLKYKDFQDIALPIIDITENDANPKHGTPWFELKGKKFKAGCKLSHEDREDLLTNKDQYIGKTAELRYFELSEDGICRFPVMVGIRLDK